MAGASVASPGRSEPKDFCLARELCEEGSNKSSHPFPPDGEEQKGTKPLARRGEKKILSVFVSLFRLR